MLTNSFVGNELKNEMEREEPGLGLGVLYVNSPSLEGSTSYNSPSFPIFLHTSEDIYPWQTAST